MKIRSDSPFYGITEIEKDRMLDAVDNFGESYDDVAEEWSQKRGMEITTVQVKRFVQRLRYERAIRSTDDSMDDLDGFAARGEGGKSRDGLIEAARQKLFEEALADGDKELLLKLYSSAHEERAREREVEVRRRTAAVAEENAKLGWRKLELQRAASALRLLPKLQAVLMEGEGTAEERLARAREVLMVGGARLLEETSFSQEETEGAEKG